MVGTCSLERSDPKKKSYFPGKENKQKHFSSWYGRKKNSRSPKDLTQWQEPYLQCYKKRWTHWRAWLGLSKRREFMWAHLRRHHATRGVWCTLLLTETQAEPASPGSWPMVRPHSGLERYGAAVWTHVKEQRWEFIMYYRNYKGRFIANKGLPLLQSRSKNALRDCER